MTLSVIASTVSYHYNTKIADEGNVCFIYTGTIAQNSYGEKLPDAQSSTGSYIDSVLLANFRAEERQFLPEGNRNDEVLTAFFKTGSVIGMGQQFLVSGTTSRYEVIQVTKFPIAGNTMAYQKTLVRRM